MKTNTPANRIAKSSKPNGQSLNGEKPSQEQEAINIRNAAMSDLSPVNIIFADTDLVIQYLNKASIKTLGKLEDLLPVRVDEIVGQSIDIFHENPSHQRGLLSDPRNLPRQANIKVGPETLDLLVSPIENEEGESIGFMVTWEVVTEKLKTEITMSRALSMMDQAPINIMFCNPEFEIRYVNAASVKTLKTIEKLLPVPADQVIGQSVDIFHKNPAHQRRILSDPNNLPMISNIQLAEETLELQVNPIFGPNKEYMGAMVSWEVITQRLAMEKREKEMTEGLKKTLQAVSENADSLASASEELSSVAQQLSSSSEETSAQANVVASASEQVSSNVSTVATSAEEMSVSVKEIAKSANEAAEVATEAVRVAKETNQTISKLGESSVEIGNVIKVITSIAQQTNLLALNATIEAARAGEAGKGFAVVANEVKELAKQTARATEDISQKIATIQSDSNGAVASIGEIAGVISQINDISSTIASSVEEQAVTTNEIARNAGEAAKGSVEISQNITNVSEAADSTSRGANDTLSASKELAQLAASLKSIVASSHVQSGN